jgi:hypothetical protein
MTNLIHVVENVISQEDADKVINFIDSGDSFFDYGRFRDVRMLRYGYDVHFEENDKSFLTEEIKNIIYKLAAPIMEKSKELFPVDESYLNQAWLVKRLPGNFHALHDDCGDGDGHVQFAGVVYLNKAKGGSIFFPKLLYRYQPKALSMIIFDTKNILCTHGVDFVESDRYSIAFWTTGDKKYELSL